MTEKQKDDLVRYRFTKAQEAIVEVNGLMQMHMWNLAVNRLYYACYYAVSALLANSDISSKTHAGTRQMFGQHFVVTGKVKKSTGEYYSKIFTYRQKGDYEDFFDYTESDISELIPPAKELVAEIGILLSSS